MFHVLSNGELEQLFFGSRIRPRNTYDGLTPREQRKSTPSWNTVPQTVQPELIKTEYPSRGHGDFRTPAYEILQANGSRTTEFTVERFTITEGKTRISGLPSSFDDDGDDAQTLTIHLHDALSQCRLDLHYTVFPHEDVIVRSASFTNVGNERLVIDAAMSINVDLPDSDYDLVQFSGA